MWYIVGLGNPGSKYANTRHNVGWSVLDALVATAGWETPRSNSAYQGLVTTGVIAKQPVTLLYPETFMNLSGRAVMKLVSRAEVKHLIVIHDDIDIPFGTIKIGVGRGAGGNNGVQSIIDEMGTKDFIRIRIGIAPRHFLTGKVLRPQGGGPLERFVLKPFSKKELATIADTTKTVHAAVSLLIEKGPDAAMNTFN